jgi:hypothetical protein
MSDALSLIFSTLALIISCIFAAMTWKKSRSIYGIEKMVIREPRENCAGDSDAKSLDNINKKLSSGNYTILAVYERRCDQDTEILLGRLNN